MGAQGEDKRKSIGLTVSILVHGILLLLFFFIVAWREPNPPIPEYGIELSFGMAVSGKSTSPKKISAPQPPQQLTESSEQDKLASESTNSRESSEEVASPTESTDQPVEVEESSEASTSEPKVQESKPSQDENTGESTEVEQEIKKEDTSESTDVANDEEDQEDSPEKNNEEEESTGNNGTKNIDERALYGRKEGASKQGSYLNIKGWIWDGKPKPNDTSRENGKIVFQITIDDRGDIIGIKTLESTVTPAVEKIYKDEVGRLTFSPTSDNFSPAAISKGEITFIIRSK